VWNNGAIRKKRYREKNTDFSTRFFNFASLMTEKKKSKTGYWLLTLVSLTAFVLCCLYLPQALWMPLPTTFGGFALAMDWI
jgi:hypothetical protein